MHGFKRRTTDARDCKGARRDDVQCAAGTDARVVNECLFQGVAASAAEPQNSIVKLEPSCMRLLHNVRLRADGTQINGTLDHTCAAAGI